jgi:hypothetical protein
MGLFVLDQQETQSVGAHRWTPGVRRGKRGRG